MQERELFETLLGLSKPWYVNRVDLTLGEGGVHVYVEHRRASKWDCPVCGAKNSVYDHAEERVWRHLDTMQYGTYVHARVPRIRCEAHGVVQVQVPWAEPRSRFTMLFERFAIQVLLSTSVAAASRILRISWEEAWAIQQRAVERGLERKELTPPKYLGVDEKAIARGRDAYVTVVCDLKAGTVEWVAPRRTAESLGSYFAQFGIDELEQIDGIAMDAWRGYGKAIHEYIPDAEQKVIYDRFHVMKEINDALDMVRKREQRALEQIDDDSLTGTKFWWLCNAKKMPRGVKAHFAGLRGVLSKTPRAWAIKESLRHFWELKTRRGGELFFRRWYFWVTHSKLPSMIKAARKLKRHLHRMLNYFDHRISNAMAESINGRLEQLKRIANGYRNVDNFRTAVFFRFGGLDLLPSTH